LLNLLNNAIKFTDFGKVTLNVSYKNDRASFDVIDTGYGIPQDKIDKIFMPFRQLSDYRLKSEGTGLGLPISKKIIEMMGGSISVQSTFGKGSQFSFEVELKEVSDTNATVNTNQKIVSYDGDPKLILIADDEQTDRHLLKSLLQPKGFEIIEAADGIDVLLLLEKKIPDLLLLDLIMPQLSGDDLIRELRKNDKHKSIPIIVTSACNPNDHKDMIKELELDEYILKPIDDSVLFESIKKKLNLKWNYSENETESSSGLNSEEEELVVPAEDVVRELFAAINKRNFSQFHKLLEAIEAENNTYRRFVRDMRELAVSFNANKIRKELQLIMEN
jgi:CheY-like chemotaxis protein